MQLEQIERSYSKHNETNQLKKELSDIEGPGDLCFKTHI
jgi:hypothetical protein